MISRQASDGDREREREREKQRGSEGSREQVSGQVTLKKRTSFPFCRRETATSIQTDFPMGMGRRFVLSLHLTPCPFDQESVTRVARRGRRGKRAAAQLLATSSPSFRKREETRTDIPGLEDKRDDIRPKWLSTSAPFLPSGYS